MEDRKYSPEAETGVAVDFVAKVKEKAAQLKAEQLVKKNATRLGVQKTEPQNITPLTSESPERIRKSSRAGIAATLALGLMAGSAATATGYMYISKKGPFAPEESKTAVEKKPPEAEPTPKEAITTEVHNNADLEKVLQSENIRATAKDFEFPTEKPQLHARALMFKLDSAPEDNEKVSYSWLPIRNRITKVTDTELLVAIKVVNPYIRNNPYRHIAPEGLSYRATAIDPEDPSIMYFYYDCRDKVNSDLLGQIGLKNPQKPSKILWGVSFSMPDCE